MVVFISEVAKRSDKLDGFIAALPLMTPLTLMWLFIENQSEEKNNKPCLLHFLVCNPNTTDVSTIPLTHFQKLGWANNYG